MTGEFADAASGLADTATGAVLAQAVEHERGGHEAAEGHTAQTACLNCGTALIGAHCHACGQTAHVHRTLGAFFHDLLHGVLHFEGKTWRTIPLLVWRPGRLTREYIDGKRARYVSPIALFLFVVFLTYALFNAIGSPVNVAPDAAHTAEARAAYAKNERLIAELETQRAATRDPAAIEAADAKIAALESDQRALGTVLSAVSSEWKTEFSRGFEQNPLPKDSRLAQMIAHVRENPQLTLYKVQTSAYKYSWLLIPLSVPFVWLLFAFNRRFRGYDHTVFTTYSITFMIALVAAASLLVYAGLSAIGLLLLLYAPVHMYRQLRGTYALGRADALWRMLALSLFAWVAIGLFVMGVGYLAAGG